MKDSLLNFITEAMTFFRTILDFFFKRKSKIDDIRLPSLVKLAKRISKLFQDIVDLDQYYYDFYHDEAFQYIRSPQKFSEHFVNQAGSFFEEYQRINTLCKKRATLHDQLKNARSFGNSGVITDIQEYLNLDIFRYETTTYTGNDEEFYLAFFTNICDEKKYSQRRRISQRAIKKLGNLVN